jgi:hypothetical protein
MNALMAIAMAKLFGTQPMLQKPLHQGNQKKIFVSD